MFLSQTNVCISLQYEKECRKVVYFNLEAFWKILKPNKKCSSCFLELRVFSFPLSHFGFEGEKFEWSFELKSFEAYNNALLCELLFFSQFGIFDFYIEFASFFYTTVFYNFEFEFDLFKSSIHNFGLKTEKVKEK